MLPENNGCFSSQATYLIFGTGITGTSAISFCQEHNLKFFITEDSVDKLKNLKIHNKNLDEKYKIYNYNLETIKEKNIDYLILSPSIHAECDKHKIVKICEELKIKIIADIDLFYCYLQVYNKIHNTNKQLIGITGTNGKSTTTSLTAFLLNNFGKKAIACGNIGLNCLGVDVSLYDYFVVEMSSYNLFLTKYAKFLNSILLNITEDHLAYHGTMENYVKAKEKIITISKKTVVCIDDYYSKQISLNHNNVLYVSKKNVLKKGISWQDDKFYYNSQLFYQYAFKNLLGLHNIENILCSALCVATIFKNNKLLPNIMEKVKEFRSLPHRMQIIKTISNIDFVNDSKGTNADATQKALQAYNKYDIYLIAGGQRKTAGFLFLKNDLKNVKCVFLIGEATESFARELDVLGVKYYKCKTMSVAVGDAYNFALKETNTSRGVKKKKVVLLSPLCASWDQYQSFEERGEDFIHCVKNIKDKQCKN